LAARGPVCHVPLVAALLTACLLVRGSILLGNWNRLADRLDIQARAFPLLEPRSRVLPILLLPELSTAYPETHFLAWAVPDREIYLPTLFALPDQHTLRVTPLPREAARPW